MLKQRIVAVEAIAADFLALQPAADNISILGARCVATMFDQRQVTGLSISTGVAAIELVSDAAVEFVDARGTLIEAQVAIVTSGSAPQTCARRMTTS